MSEEQVRMLGFGIATSRVVERRERLLRENLDDIRSVADVRNVHEPNGYWKVVSGQSISLGCSLKGCHTIAQGKAP